MEMIFFFRFQNSSEWWLDVSTVPHQNQQHDNFTATEIRQHFIAVTLSNLEKNKESPNSIKRWLSFQQDQVIRMNSVIWTHNLTLMSPFVFLHLNCRKKLFPSVLILLCLLQRHSGCNIEHPQRLAPGGKQRGEKKRRASMQLHFLPQ